LAVVHVKVTTWGAFEVLGPNVALRLPQTHTDKLCHPVHLSASCKDVVSVEHATKLDLGHELLTSLEIVGVHVVEHHEPVSDFIPVETPTLNGATIPVTRDTARVHFVVALHPLETTGQGSGHFDGHFLNVSGLGLDSVADRVLVVSERDKTKNRILNIIKHIKPSYNLTST
jgi:hypothetical protein